MRPGVKRRLSLPGHGAWHLHIFLKGSLWISKKSFCTEIIFSFSCIFCELLKSILTWFLLTLKKIELYSAFLRLNVSICGRFGWLSLLESNSIVQQAWNKIHVVTSLCVIVFLVDRLSFYVLLPPFPQFFLSQHRLYDIFIWWGFYEQLTKTE